MNEYIRKWERLKTRGSETLSQLDTASHSVMFESVLGVGEGGDKCAGVFQSIFSGVAVLVVYGSSF